MRIAILGGAGFLGSNLAHYCTADPANEVLIIDSLEPRLRSTPANLDSLGDRIAFVQGSIEDQDLVKDRLRDIDVIFNCAAQTSHPMSMADPLFDARINCLGNLSFLEALRSINSDAAIIYVSSSTVVGRETRHPIDEHHLERPLDIYSADKLAAENYYRIYHQVHGLRTIVIRLPNLYGPYGKEFPEFGFVNYFIGLARANRDITIFGPGEQTRNLLYAEDAARVLYLAAMDERMVGGIFFAAHPKHYSVRQVAEKIVETFETGRVRNVPWPADRRRIEVEGVEISGSLLSGMLEWAPLYDLDQGLRKTRSILDEVLTG